MYLVAISTRFTAGRLERFWIPVPYTPNAAGVDPKTGLDKPCVLKCNWTVRFNVRAIDYEMGTIPDDVFERAVEFAIAAIEEKKRTMRP